MVAGWEAATDQKVVRNAVMREYSKLHAQRQAALEARREALAQQLFHEESALQAELIASRQTPEEKRQELMRRAQGLWEAREAERQATANALLERHFRCAAARTAARPLLHAHCCSHPAACCLYPGGCSLFWISAHPIDLSAIFFVESP